MLLYFNRFIIKDGRGADKPRERTSLYVIVMCIHIFMGTMGAVPRFQVLYCECNRYAPTAAVIISRVCAGGWYSKRTSVSRLHLDIGLEGLLSTRTQSRTVGSYSK